MNRDMCPSEHSNGDPAYLDFDPWPSAMAVYEKALPWAWAKRHDLLFCDPLVNGADITIHAPDQVQPRWRRCFGARPNAVRIQADGGVVILEIGRFGRENTFIRTRRHDLAARSLGVDRRAWTEGFKQTSRAVMSIR